MEMQFFVEPGKEMNFYDDWKDKRMKWHKSLDLGDHLYRFHNHENLAHYANAACDIEFLFPMGFKELEGIHSRTDFDLKSHQKLSGKKINYYDQKTKSSFIPYVIETSVGLDRLFLRCDVTGSMTVGECGILTNSNNAAGKITVSSEM